MVQKIKIKTIAAALGYDEQTVRLMAQYGKCPYITAFKQEGKRCYTYIVSPELARQHIGAERLQEAMRNVQA